VKIIRRIFNNYIPIVKFDWCKQVASQVSISE